MSKYIIKAQLSPVGGNPDFAPDSEMVNGIEADGFLLMTMKDDRPSVVTIYGMTTMDLARMLAGDKSEACSVIRQAIAIAEGLNKAAGIAREDGKTKRAREIAEMLRSK
ncbi:MAG: hypothetical protein II008_08300 [Oscillospiraceae bacterium]|nr:hypothetical protein [Oscillospiraceae bacterium]